MTHLVWFRADLRVDDHEPLARAAAAGPTLGVYCVDPRQFGDGLFGIPKTGPFRARFLLESVAALRESLRARGGELVVRVGPPEEIVPALAREIGATDLWYHEEACPEERDVEDAVGDAVEGAGLATHPCWGHTLLHPDDLPFPVEGLPSVFTQFRTRVEKAGVEPRAPYEAPTVVRPPAVVPDPGVIPDLAALGIEGPAPDARARFVFAAGEEGARARIASWVWERDRLRRYKETRNGMLDPDDSSRFSPWLAHGCLSPRRLWREVQHYERERVRNDSTYWLVFELLWRDYFRFAAYNEGARLFAAAGPRGVAVRWRRTASVFEAWCRGETGVALVDASQRELVATGWTSNRARQNVASWLAKTQGIDWRMGAAWYERWLVDYDPASNWGNWAYAAGVGHDPREGREFNQERQAAQYDADGGYRRHWLG